MVHQKPNAFQYRNIEMFFGVQHRYAPFPASLCYTDLGTHTCNAIRHALFPMLVTSAREAIQNIQGGGFGRPYAFLYSTLSANLAASAWYFA
jgi:hypothetical protein